MAVNIRVKVHPVVLFQIADAYERRDMEKYRVIGTLLGKSVINIKYEIYISILENLILRLDNISYLFVSFRQCR